MKPILERLWTVEDVADFFKVEISVIKYWIYNSGLPYIKLGKHKRFDPTDLMAWVEKRKSGMKHDNEKLRKIK